MLSQRQLDGGIIDLDWNETTGNYILSVQATGDKKDLLTLVDKLRCELATMYYQVKADILKEYAAIFDRIEF